MIQAQQARSTRKCLKLSNPGGCPYIRAKWSQHLGGCRAHVRRWEGGAVIGAASEGRSVTGEGRRGMWMSGA